MTPSATDVERWLETLFVAAEGAHLRDEDRKKAVEVSALLSELERAIARMSRSRPLTIVDAAAGKAYVGLLAAKLVLEGRARPGKVVCIERDDARAHAARQAAAQLGSPVPIDVRTGDLDDASAWPESPDVVVGLHACGPASDAVIAHAAATRARALLLVPCCTGAAVAAARRARARAESLGLPDEGPVRARFVEAWVAAERTWELEAAGYETEVVELVSPTVTPYNLVWRSRRVGEPRRMETARAALDRMRQGIEQPP